MDTPQTTASSITKTLIFVGVGIAAMVILTLLVRFNLLPATLLNPLINILVRTAGNGIVDPEVLDEIATSFRV